MKKLIMFLGGLVLIALTLGMLFLTSAIYDSVRGTQIDTYFFQRNNYSAERTGAPETPGEIGETTMREMLIKKFVNEYFYVIPDAENIARRISKSTSVLYKMASPAVFSAWQGGEAETIQDMADHRKMRIVEIDGEIFMPSGSDYWVVPYVLYTWDESNDMAAAPTVSRGQLLMNVSFEMGLRETVGGEPFDVGKYLKDGYNTFESANEPAAIFKFRVNDLEDK
jgi:hypothetical protein